MRALQVVQAQLVIKTGLVADRHHSPIGAQHRSAEVPGEIRFIPGEVHFHHGTKTLGALRGFEAFADFPRTRLLVRFACSGSLKGF